MAKLFALLVVAAVLLQVVVATEAEASKPKKSKKPKKYVKPHMHPRWPHHHRNVVIVPKGDPRARPPTAFDDDVVLDDVVIAGDRVLPLHTFVVDDSPYDAVARDIERRFFGPNRAVSRVADVPDARILAPHPNNQPISLPVAPQLPQVPQVPQVPTPAVAVPAGAAAAAAAAAVPAARPVLKSTPGAGCTKIGGTCGKVASCTGTVTKGLCPGDSTVSCCVPKQATTVTPTTPTTPTPTTPVSNGLPMCSNNGAASGSYDGQSSLLAVKGVATRWSLSPALTYAQESANGNSYRATRDAYGNLPETDSRLVNVPSADSRTMKLHRVCAARFTALAAAAKAAGMGDLKVASGWRPHLWNNDYAYYCREMKKQYPTRTCQQAGQVRAFKSAHETGLAFDLGSPSPMSPQLAQKPAQLKSKIFAWLSANAHKYGVTPYQYEPWHWECVIPRESWVKACEFTTNYNTRVRETRVDNGKVATDGGAWK